MPYLYKALQVFWVNTGEVQQEVSARVLQLHVLSLLSRSLQSAEDHSAQHQVEKHPREDAEQGGAAHGCTSTQSKCRLLFLLSNLSAGVDWIPAAAAETSATTQTQEFSC